MCRRVSLVDRVSICIWPTNIGVLSSFHSSGQRLGTAIVTQRIHTIRQPVATTVAIAVPTLAFQTLPNAATRDTLASIPTSLTPTALAPITIIRDVMLIFLGG